MPLALFLLVAPLISLCGPVLDHRFNAKLFRHRPMLSQFNNPHPIGFKRDRCWGIDLDNISDPCLPRRGCVIRAGTTTLCDLIDHTALLTGRKSTMRGGVFPIPPNYHNGMVSKGERGVLMFVVAHFCALSGIRLVLSYSLSNCNRFVACLSIPSRPCPASRRCPPKCSRRIQCSGLSAPRSCTVPWSGRGAVGDPQRQCSACAQVSFSVSQPLPHPFRAIRPLNST